MAVWQEGYIVVASSFLIASISDIAHAASAWLALPLAVGVGYLTNFTDEKYGPYFRRERDLGTYKLARARIAVALLVLSCALESLGCMPCLAEGAEVASRGELVGLAIYLGGKHGPSWSGRG